MGGFILAKHLGFFADLLVIDNNKILMFLFQVETMLRTAGMTEKGFRYHANTQVTSWAKLLAVLCILTNEDINIRNTIELNNQMSQ